MVLHFPQIDVLHLCPNIQRNKGHENNLPYMKYGFFEGFNWNRSYIYVVFECCMRQYRAKYLLDFMWGAVLFVCHYSDDIMGAMPSQITNLTIVYSTVYSGTDQRKHQSSASLALVWGIIRWPVNSWNKRPVLRKMFPYDDVIIGCDCVVFLAVWLGINKNILIGGFETFFRFALRV